MDPDELINELWDILAIGMANSEKIYNIREMIREWAEDTGHELPEIRDEQEEY